MPARAGTLLLSTHKQLALRVAPARGHAYTPTGMAPAAKSTAARSADTGTSVRARSRHDPHDPQRRLVYKPVLGNPLDLDW